MSPAAARLVSSLVLVGASLVACGGGGELDGVAAPPGSGGAAGASSRPPGIVYPGATPAGGAASFDWGLPNGFPRPRVPADNPMSGDKVELGRRLFYDKRLSENQTQSCGSCHLQKLAFTDGRATGLGSTGEAHPRSPMSLANVGYFSTLTWANPLVTTLEKQALLPLFGEAPVELGLAGKEELLLARLAADPEYVTGFAKAFPGESSPIRVDNVTRAIAAFERTLISGNSPFDRYSHGDASALTESARRGRDLFFSEKLECFHCHGSFLLTDSVTYEGKTIAEELFHNTGLYNLDGKGAYPVGNRGVYELTFNPPDMGRFRAPSLRNIAVTAPYMHDGSVATLDEALDHYAAGGRTVPSGPYAGNGSMNPYKSEFLVGFSLSPGERADVLAFLHSLTDEAFLTDPRYADPWLPSGSEEPVGLLAVPDRLGRPTSRASPVGIRTSARARSARTCADRHGPGAADAPLALAARVPTRCRQGRGPCAGGVRRRGEGGSTADHASPALYLRL